MVLFKKHVVIFSLILLFGFVSISYGGDTRGVTSKTVKIGLMGDLTGPIADVWIPISLGAKALLNKINDEGGIHGRKIKYIIEDDRYSIPLALSGFKKLVHRDGILALQGASGVGHTGAIVPLCTKEKIPIITASAEPRLFKPVRKYVFCGIPWYQDQAKIVMDYVFKDLKKKNPVIVLMHPDVGSGKDTRDAMRKLVKKYPVKEYREIVITLSGLDFTTELLLVRRLKPDFVYIHGYVANTAAIMKFARRLNVSTTFLVSQYGCTHKTLEVAGAAAKGLLGISCYGTWGENTPGVKQLRKGSKMLDPSVKIRGANFFQGWFIGTLFERGLRNAGRNLNVNTYLKGMESVKNYNTQGISGSITFGPNDHKSIEYSRIYKADVGTQRFIPITGWRK